jgi:ABC-type polysaccharide/polyol phosphate transport system ATPase subunit
VSASIVAEDLGIRFYFDRQQRLTTPAVARLRRGVTERWGLRRLSVEIRGGDAVALIGRSGAGKTTLLRVLSGIFEPDEGRLSVEGRLGSVLSIEAGLLPRLTGRENTALLGVLAGLSRAEARSGAEDVRERSGLGDAFELPVSSYSQGMLARLGFAVVDQVQPDILLLDEVHEALDHEFRARVQERVQEILARGGIVVAAGHDHPLLEQVCNRALLVDEGHIAADGSFEEVVHVYFDELDGHEPLPADRVSALPASFSSSRSRRRK